MADDSPQQSTVGGMRIVASCPWCQIPDVATKAQSVRSVGEHHLFHIVCPSCHNAILAIVETGRVGMSCIGVVTDMSVQDVELMLEGDPLTIDDVILTHEALNGADFLKEIAVLRSQEQ